MKPNEFSDYEAEGRRKRAFGLLFLQDPKRENNCYYAHPIEGLLPVVDLAQKRVVELLKGPESIKIPEKPFSVSSQPDPRARPLVLTQPKGVSFRVNSVFFKRFDDKVVRWDLQVTGKRVEWFDWSFSLGFTCREGLVLRQVRFRGRSILARLNIRTKLNINSNSDRLFVAKHRKCCIMIKRSHQNLS